ncbi:hypothetical protein SDC9_202514 [bioreactor metagenome]|uniref:Uncharacterized protein n=1 Tax=bioreactor metagenome TaxID=1076179 RepID=A0A645IUL6_9ZZZZ
MACLLDNGIQQSGKEFTIAVILSHSDLCVGVKRAQLAVKRNPANNWNMVFLAEFFRWILCFQTLI